VLLGAGIEGKAGRGSIELEGVENAADRAARFITGMGVEAPVGVASYF